MIGEAYAPFSETVTPVLAFVSSIDREEKANTRVGCRADSENVQVSTGHWDNVPLRYLD